MSIKRGIVMRLTTNENGLYVDNNCIVPQSNDIITKLGKYEDIDENPEHLADIKKALEIIKPLVDLTKEYNICWVWVGLNGVQIPQEKYDLLKAHYRKEPITMTMSFPEIEKGLDRRCQDAVSSKGNNDSGE